MEINSKFSIGQTVCTLTFDGGKYSVREFEIKSIGITLEPDGTPVVSYSSSETLTGYTSVRESLCFSSKDNLLQKLSLL